MDNRKGDLTVEEKPNGNIIFSYRLKKMKQTSWIIIIPLIFLLIVFIAFCGNQVLENFLVLFFLMLIYTFIFISIWLSYTSKKNKKVEKEIINKLLEKRIEDDIHKQGGTVRELERKYMCLIGNESFLEAKRYLTVLLSNGKELKYNVINAQSYGSTLVLEIEIHPEILD